MKPILRILETPEEMAQIEALQRVVWPGSETDVIPAHLLLTAAHNGGLVIGAYIEETLAGFTFGFPGLEQVPDGPRPKHCSHELGVHPDYRNAGLGFALKRAQWQAVRSQGLDHITWTYDPLLSRNAHLNIARLGAVCNTYLREVYGEMRDGLNVGLPSDRFQVDWWINTPRVERRLGDQPRRSLTLGHYRAANTPAVYPVKTLNDGLIAPPLEFSLPAASIILAEIPSDFLALKSANLALAYDWRIFTREVFESAFSAGYLVTDFLYETGEGLPRSFYALTNGESTLD
jgi:predicted GNAT superfamily acetyltransferase